MKYIRTKDNRIICITDFDIDLETNCYVKGDIRIKLSDAIKGTEQLEELIDEFVVIYAGKPKIVKRKYLYDYWASKHEIYATIWTEWGLKYVAKMNDESELELL